MNDLEIAEQEVTLGALVAPLAGDGYRSELISASDDLEMPTLVIQLDQDPQGRDRFLTVNVVPMDGVENVDISLLQLYAPMPFSLETEHTAEFGRFTLLAGPSLPVGSLGARPDGEVYVRYMATTSARSTPDPVVMGDLVSLIEFEADVFGPPMEAVAADGMSASDAMAMLGGG